MYYCLYMHTKNMKGCTGNIGSGYLCEREGVFCVPFHKFCFWIIHFFFKNLNYNKKILEILISRYFIPWGWATSNGDTVPKTNPLMELLLIKICLLKTNKQIGHFNSCRYKLILLRYLKVKYLFQLT